MLFFLCSCRTVELWFSRVLKVRAWLCWVCGCRGSQHHLLGVPLVLSLVSSMAASQLWGHHHLQDGKEEVACTVLGATQGWALAGGFSAIPVFAPDMVLGYSIWVRKLFKKVFREGYPVSVVSCFCGHPASWPTPSQVWREDEAFGSYRTDSIYWN